MLDEAGQEELRGELRAIRTLLGQKDTLAPNVVASLGDVIEDIERLLEKDKHDDGVHGDWKRIRESWQQSVLDFESHHPEATKAFAAITGILANLGI